MKIERGVNTKMQKIVAEYITELSDKSSITRKNYLDEINRFLCCFNVQTLEDFQAITRKKIVEYRSKIKGQSNSVNTKMRYLSAFYGWLERAKYISDNPIQTIKPLKESKKVPLVLTNEEIQRMIDVSETLEEKTMISLMAATGVRREELVNIKISDFDGQHVLVHGKGDKERIIPVKNETYDLIKLLLMNRKSDSPYLITSIRGGHNVTPETVRVRVKNIGKAAGISPQKLKKLTPHTFRRTFITDLVNKETNVLIVKTLVGHESVTTTDRYFVASQSALDKAILGK